MQSVPLKLNPKASHSCWWLYTDHDERFKHKISSVRHGRWSLSLHPL